MEKNSFFIGKETKNKEMTYTEKLSPLVGESVSGADERGKCEQRWNNRNKCEQKRKNDGRHEMSFICVIACLFVGIKRKNREIKPVNLNKMTGLFVKY